MALGSEGKLSQLFGHFVAAMTQPHTACLVDYLRPLMLTRGLVPSNYSKGSKCLTISRHYNIPDRGADSGLYIGWPYDISGIVLWCHTTIETSSKRQIVVRLKKRRSF